MNLFYREHGSGQPIIILHGLFGSSDNWLTIGKQLSEEYKIYLVDQRNHGQSPHSEVFDYKAMANDLSEFIKDNAIENPIIIGHSMGGKVAMQFAVDNPDKWNKLVVVDIAPKAYPVHHDTILSGLQSIQLNELNSRGDADKQLSAYVDKIGVRQFLLKNLQRTSEGFSWKINLPVISANIEIIGAAAIGTLKADKPVLFINGATSNYITKDDFDEIHRYFPTAKINTVAGAGHWVHAEKPEEFLTIVENFLNNG